MDKNIEKQSVEKIKEICKELNLQVKAETPIEKNTYLSAWHKGNHI